MAFLQWRLCHCAWGTLTLSCFGFIFLYTVLFIYVRLLIVGSFISLSGDRWVSFLQIEECPIGWNWEGGVKLLKSI
jgi:hypothetical protein